MADAPRSRLRRSIQRVGRPIVIRDSASRYRMYHHCIDVERVPQGGEICLATSADGFTWSEATTRESTPLVRGRVVRAVIGSWHEAHETPFAYVDGASTVLLILGYRGAGFFVTPGSSAVGRATGDGAGLSFALRPEPVLRAGPDPKDRYGITSPSVVRQDDGSLVLYYVGWCTDGSCAPFRLSLLAATSTDGISWDKHPMPIVEDPGVPWAHGGVSEPEVVRGPDGRYFLFFSSLSGPEGSANRFQRIGVAVSDGAFGPFRFQPEPILRPEDLGAWANGGALAPAVLFEGGVARMWFHGFELDATGQTVGARIGYSEIDARDLP